MVSGRRRTVIVAGLVLCALVGAWTAWYFLASSPVSLPQEATELDVTVQDLSLTQGGKGQRTWRLQAKQSRYLKAESQIEFDQPRVTFYQKKDVAQITARAPAGIYWQKKGRAELWPQVRAEYGPTTVLAKRMIFIQKKQHIIFTGEVRISHPQVQATAQRAVFDLHSSQLILYDQVEVDVHGK